MKISQSARAWLSYEMPNRVVRWRDGIGYYFTSFGIYQSGTKEELIRRGIISRKWKIEYVTNRNALYEPQINGVSSRLVKIAITSLKVGDTLETFFDYIENAESDRRPLPAGLDRFITKIDGPFIQREVGNKNTKTFDFVYVDVCLVQSWDSDKREYIKTNMREIKRRVIEKIEKSSRFTRYGIPVNFLKITSITLTRDDVLHFIFELKEIK